MTDTTTNRALITVPQEDVELLDQLATTHQVPDAFGRAVRALERELASPLRRARASLTQLRIALGVEPIAQLIEPEPPELCEEDRRAIEEAVWQLGEDLAVRTGVDG